ncbi:hypothetical protein ACS2CQ_23515 [Bacillus cereus group sp. BceL295]
MDNKVEAINNFQIDDMRKDFIFSRITYWEGFCRKQSNGLRNTGNWE